MANQYVDSIPIEKRVAIIQFYDSTLGMKPRVGNQKIADRFGVHRSTVEKTLINRDAYLKRAAFEGFAEKVIERPKEFNIGVLPDCQVKPGISLDYLEWAGKFFAAKKPDVIVNIGDFADMPSLSFHDQPGSMGYEGKRYKLDILSVHEGMKRLMTPIIQEMQATGWKPRLVLTLGNHEDRINRTIKATPKLDGMMGLPDLEYERWGWEVVPFLKPIIIEGVAFCHYFASGVMGRPVTTAQALITKKHMSCVAGHQQGRDVKHGYRADGREITAIIAGSYYEHDEDYLNHQTNQHFRGLFMLRGVADGVIDSAVAVNINHLRRVYG